MFLENLFPVCDQAGEGGGGGGSAGGGAAPSGGGGAPAASGGAPAGATGGGGAPAAAPKSSMDKLRETAAAVKSGTAPVAKPVEPAPAGAALQVDPAKAAADAAAFQAKLKYKVLKEEKDFPDWAKPLATTPETETQLKDLLERADGIESVKAHRDQLIQQTQQFQQEVMPFVADARKALAFAKGGDLKSFFEMTGVPDAAVLKYALKVIQHNENPQLAAQEEHQRQLQLKNQQLQDQAQQYQNGYQELAVQQKDFELSVALSRPEILATVQAFDAKVGTPGAFRTEVIRRGQAYAAMGQKNVSAEQVVTEVVQLLTWQGQSAQNPPPPAGVQNGAGAPMGATAHVPPPALPNLRGKGGSPVKKAFKSTDELRKHARSLRG
jgi:hypothetical protein